MPVFMSGRKVGYQQVPVDVDEDTLQKIADKTGGKYYRADNAERFRQIYAEIDKLEKTEAVINKFAQFDELFPWFVSCGLAILLVEVVLGSDCFAEAAMMTLPINRSFFRKGGTGVAPRQIRRRAGVNDRSPLVDRTNQSQSTSPDGFGRAQNNRPEACAT
jgi:hypothetical protein